MPLWDWNDGSADKDEDQSLDPSPDFRDGGRGSLEQAGCLD